MRSLLVLLFCFVLAACTPQTVKVCVPNDSCGPNGQVVGIQVGYYCVCDPDYVGQFCERHDIAKFYDVNKQPRVSKTIQLDSGLFCQDVQTQCINGNPQLLDPTAECA
ncbi:hypothetical protein M3Y99_01895300 [Aphelenchoides fujianensis]|nr:hypothetical protein M3Y99_01895300 [Aphelenchoides fujianensis]